MISGLSEQYLRRQKEVPSSHPRTPQDFRLRPLALDLVILTLCLALGKFLRLLAGHEPSQDAVSPLIAVDGPADAAPAAVRLGVNAGVGEAAGGVPQAPVVGERNREEVIP